MERRDPTDPFAGLKGAAEEYKVYDAHYERVGRVDDLIVDGSDQVLYIGVKMGILGTNSTIVPAEVVRVNDKRRLVEVSEPAESIERAPHFSGGDELTPEMENHVRGYFGLEALRPTPEHDPQGPHVPPDDRFATDDRVDTAPGERLERQERAPEPRDTASGERPSGEPGPPEGHWEPVKTVGGITIHRLRR